MTDRDVRPAGTRSIEALTEEFRGRDYITDRSLATAVFLALELGRPLLLEGEAGEGAAEMQVGGVDEAERGHGTRTGSLGSRAPRGRGPGRGRNLAGLAADCNARP